MVNVKVTDFKIATSCVRSDLEEIMLANGFELSPADLNFYVLKALERMKEDPKSAAIRGYSVVLLSDALEAARKDYNL